MYIKAYTIMTMAYIKEQEISTSPCHQNKSCLPFVLNQETTDMLWGDSAAMATAGSRLIFTGRPYTRKNWVGSSFCNKTKHVLFSIEETGLETYF